MKLPILATRYPVAKSLGHTQEEEVVAMPYSE
jgi:hypothetical protein